MKVKVGDRIVMRHTYPNCPVLPEYFRTFDNGSYPQGCVSGLQGVYVIVRVTTLPVPNSSPPPGIPDTEIKETWNHSYCTIEFERMGLMRDLDASTTSYITGLQTPTISIINGEEAKSDLWKKATTTPAQVGLFPGGIQNSAPNPNANDPGWRDNQEE